MRDSGASGKEAISIATVLCACLVLVIFTGGPSSDSLENFKDGVTGYIISELLPGSQESTFMPKPTLFTFPALPTYSPRGREMTPSLRTPLQPGFSLSSNYQTSGFFQGGMGYMRISIKNEGQNPIFIDKYGVSVNASKSQIYPEDCGVLIPPGEEQDLGVITVQIPEEEKASFSIVLWLLAETSTGKWHEYEP